MKRISERYRKWLAHRQRAANKTKVLRANRKTTAVKPLNENHIVKCWTSDGNINAIARRRTVPPKRLCYDENSGATYSFLELWCRKISIFDPQSARKMKWIRKGKNPRSMARISSYVDFSELEFISTEAALVMTAEYDRLATLIGKNPPAVNLEKWNAEVLKKLFEIGFFENIGLIDELEDRFNEIGDIKILKITSGRNARELEAVCGQVLQLCDFMEVTDREMRAKMVDLNSALGEAMINVAKHAHPENHDFDRPHVGKWWITAEVDRRIKMLKVAIFDQGATIPITFPRKRVTTAIKDTLAVGLSSSERFAYDSDGTYIYEAMQLGMTQTDERHRGKGLPEMVEIVDALGNASMTIYSRGGKCKYDHNGFDYSSQPHTIGGTLIEWTLRFDESN